MGVGTVASSSGLPCSGELRAEKRGAYYALAKNPDKYVSYQQAQQQTEDDSDDNEDEDDDEDEDNEKEDPEQDNDDEDSEKIIHL